MDLQADVFAVDVVAVRRIDGRRTAVATEEGAPVGASRSVAQRAVVLRAADDAAIRAVVARAAVELRDGEAVVERGPSRHRAGDGSDILRFVYATIVAEVDRAVGAAVIAGRVDDDVVVGMHRAGTDVEPLADLRPAKATVDRAEQVDTARDQVARVDRIDPKCVVVPALVAQVAQRGLQRPGSTVVRRAVDHAGIHVDAGVDHAGLARKGDLTTSADIEVGRQPCCAGVGAVHQAAVRVRGGAQNGPVAVERVELHVGHTLECAAAQAPGGATVCAAVQALIGGREQNVRVARMHHQPVYVVPVGAERGVGGG